MPTSKHLKWGWYLNILVTSPVQTCRSSFRNVGLDWLLYAAVCCYPSAKGRYFRPVRLLYVPLFDNGPCGTRHPFRLSRVPALPPTPLFSPRVHVLNSFNKHPNTYWKSFTTTRQFLQRVIRLHGAMQRVLVEAKEGDLMTCIRALFAKPVLARLIGNPSREFAVVFSTAHHFADLHESGPRLHTEWNLDSSISSGVL